MNIVRSMLPERFLKVPATGPSSSAADVFVPAWDLKVDNLAVDAQSLREFAEHAIPPAVAEKLARLSAVDAKRARLLMSFWDYALQCDEQARTERLTEQWKLNAGVVNRQEEEIAALKLRTEELERALGSANEAKMKAEADLQAERVQRAEAVAALAPLQEQVRAAEAEKAALVEKDKQLQSRYDNDCSSIYIYLCFFTEQVFARRFDDLSTDLAAARKEVSELEAACDLNLKDFNDIQVKNDELADDLERLQRGIPGLVKLALASDSVTTPFKEFVTAVQEVEVLQTINLIAEHVPELPTPLPDVITSRVNPDCYERAQRAGEALKAISVPFIERIGREMELSVDEILEMRP